MLRWTTVTNSRHDFVADMNEGENVGRFRVKRVPRRRKTPWAASFKGSMRTGPATFTSERQQNFIATEAEAKAICEGWANGKTMGSCLMEINADRQRAAS